MNDSTNAKRQARWREKRAKEIEQLRKAAKATAGLSAPSQELAEAREQIITLNAEMTALKTELQTLRNRKASPAKVKPVEPPPLNLDLALDEWLDRAVELVQPLCSEGRIVFIARLMKRTGLSQLDFVVNDAAPTNSLKKRLLADPPVTVSNAPAAERTPAKDKPAETVFPQKELEAKLRPIIKRLRVQAKKRQVYEFEPHEIENIAFDMETLRTAGIGKAGEWIEQVRRISNKHPIEHCPFDLELVAFDMELLIDPATAGTRGRKHRTPLTPKQKLERLMARKRG